MEESDADVIGASADRANRLRRVVEAGVSLAQRLSLDELLDRLVAEAASLAGARSCELVIEDTSSPECGKVVRAGEPEGASADDLRVPVRLRGTSYGTLRLEPQPGRPFGVVDEEAVVLVAAQAAVAIENTRLYDSARRWLRRIESLDEIVSALVSTLELDELLTLVCERLRGLLGARMVHLALLGPDQTLEIRAAAGADAATLLGYRLDLHGSKGGAAVRRREAERVDSMIDDPEVDQTIARRLGMRTCIVVPLVIRDEPIGSLAVVDRLGPDERFGDDDLRTAIAFAERAAVAIDLSERFTHETVQRIVEAEENERRRLARELHDETGQALTTILLGLKTLEPLCGAEALEPVREHVRRALREVRRLAVELRPAVLDDFGLVPALERLVRELRESGLLTVDLVAGGLDRRLPPAVETAAYRIVQEALTNVVKHAAATRAIVRVDVIGGLLRVSIEDDGRGLPLTIRDGALGMTGMRERVALLRGRLELGASPLGGARVVAEAPLR